MVVYLTNDTQILKQLVLSNLTQSNLTIELVRDDDVNVFDDSYKIYF